MREKSAIEEISVWKKRIFIILVALFFAQSIYLYSTGTTITNSHSLSPDVQAGFDLFQNKNCIACHQLYGLGGYMGPDLTNVISTQGKGRDYVAAFIQYGTKKMPFFNFENDEVESLISFLEFVDASGKYPSQNPKINWYGTVR